MNDERPIEKLLRRYAKKRRDAAGAPVELHPATRRLLQGEVARQIKNAKCKMQNAEGRSPQSDRRRFFHFEFLIFKSSRLAWAVPLLALVAVGSWLLLNRPESKQLALGSKPNETAVADGGRTAKAEWREPESPALTLDARRSIAGETAPADFGAAKAVSPSPAAIPVRVPNQPVVSLDSEAEQKVDSMRNGYKETAPANRLGVASSAAPARARFAEASSARRANPLPAESWTESDATLQTNRRITGANAANQQPLNESTALSFDALAVKSAAPGRSRPGTAAPLARSNNFGREPAQTYSQSFANLAPETPKQKTAKVMTPPPVSPVLANFRVEQTGRQLRVVDSDGSTYLGETEASSEGWADRGVSQQELAVQLFKSNGKLNQLPVAATAVPPPSLQNNFYRVVGTNRTLNQAVEFTWSFVERTNTALLAESGRIRDGQNKDAKKLPTQFPVPLQNSFITGRAQFGTGKAIEINAVPVTP